MANDLLTAAKGALGITSNAKIIEDEINDLVQAALYDLKSNGIHSLDMQDDPLIIQAVKTYVRANFHSPADHDNLQASYDQQKGHLMQTTGYTTWTGGVDNGSG